MREQTIDIRAAGLKDIDILVAANLSYVSEIF